jgi:hypothetical protein
MSNTSYLIPLDLARWQGAVILQMPYWVFEDGVRYHGLL